MKSRLFIATALTALCLASYHASAQRCLPRQMGLQLIGGPINGLLIRDKYKAYRFFGEFAMSRYNRNRSRWIIGLTYLQKISAINLYLYPKRSLHSMLGIISRWLPTGNTILSFRLG